mmetsp:Transcript_1378/g.3013  ORF Transcript_1378/g.3013 Transcript_1378/m.3013 type:complete len:238 (+) Transcript_1378:588-1301(+)
MRSNGVNVNSRSRKFRPDQDPSVRRSKTGQVFVHVIVIVIVIIVIITVIITTADVFFFIILLRVIVFVLVIVVIMTMRKHILLVGQMIKEIISKTSRHGKVIQQTMSRILLKMELRIVHCQGSIVHPTFDGMTIFVIGAQSHSGRVRIGKPPFHVRKVAAKRLPGELTRVPIRRTTMNQGGYGLLFKGGRFILPSSTRLRMIEWLNVRGIIHHHGFQSLQRDTTFLIILRGRNQRLD